MKMTFQKYIALAILLFCFVVKAQEKHELKPYNIATTYDKLKKDYPFISPIATFTSENITAIENVVYKSTKEKELKADVYLPKTEGSEKYPAVLLIHGGGWLTGSKENERVMAQHLANNGYVAVTAAYRLGTEAKYPAGVEDLKDAVKWMQENSDKYHINTEEIAVLGASAGAQLATLLGVTTNSVKAIVNIDGIVSFVHPDSEEGWMAATWFEGSRLEKYELWKEASPLEYVNENSPPTIFINSSFPRFHAGRDQMVKILDDNSIYNEIHTIKDSPHSFWLMHPWFEETLDLTLNFLDKTLKKSSEAKAPYLEISVSKDGKGDFNNIQEAINSTRDLGPGEVVININNGTYNEKLEIPSWKHQLSLIGESKEGVIIVNDDYSGKTNPQTGNKFSTFTSSTVLVQGDDVKFENLTIKNSWCEQGQAVALHVEGDRFVAKNCNILGCQDTIYTATEGSRQLYLDCFIEGTTDFIFGEATAVFQNCTIKSLKDSFVTAAATPQNQDYGYVFINCDLIAADNVHEVYLGRPWRSYAKTVFFNSELGAHIVPAGWDSWTGDKMFPNKEKTAYYAEYKSTGAGASPEARVGWSHQLTDEQAEKYTIKNIYGDDWFWASEALKK